MIWINQFNCATKYDLKGTTGFGPSKYAKKFDLGSLKIDIDI